MPLKALRPGRSERDLRRRSTLDPANFFKRGDRDTRFHQSSEDLGAGRIAVSEDGRVRPPLDAGRDEPPSPPIQEATPNTRRFSLMRFRHASDSQLSVKAKEHAARHGAPPVPAMPVNPARTYKK
jgi:hypothetical protein|tara:strand:- start:19625 stop:19999 length:375 start_codon:yes stop_codon:yes gene_type:complete